MRLVMDDIMTVYHGGTEDINVPKVDVGRENLDFGPVFYVTDIFTQARDWALKIADDRDSIPIVNTYHLKHKELLSKYRYKIF